MKVLPTSEGGLCIIPESEADWLELGLLCTDAVGASHLAESLADLMDPESGWEDYVVPDLEKTFDRQCRFVATTIEHARDHHEKAIFITPKHAEKWYGAINQARLSLEARYKLQAVEQSDVTEEIEPEVGRAYFRNHFYLFLQSMLLEYVMDATE